MKKQLFLLCAFFSLNVSQAFVEPGSFNPPPLADASFAYFLTGWGTGIALLSELVVQLAQQDKIEINDQLAECPNDLQLLHNKAKNKVIKQDATFTKHAGITACFIGLLLIYMKSVELSAAKAAVQ